MIMIARDYRPSPAERAADDAAEAARLAIIEKRNRAALAAFERRNGSRRFA